MTPSATLTARLARAHSVGLATCALLVAAAVAPSWAATGCSAGACVPRTGAWTAPSPQKLTSSLGPTTLTMKVSYQRNGKTVKSRYGNTVRDFSVYLRYFCPKGGSTLWVEKGYLAVGPIKINRDGTAKATIPPALGMTEHKLSLKFKRTTFSGRLSGTAIAFDESTVCSTAVSFSGKHK